MTFSLHKNMKLNCTQELVIEKLKSFPNRYSYYLSKNYKGKWQCTLLDCNQENVVFRFVDKTFDISKGTKEEYEAAKIILTMNHEEKGFILNVSLRWSRLKTICIALFSVIVIAFMIFAGVFQLLLPAVILFALYLYIMISGRKHDILAFNVFMELLIKNFEETEEI